MMKKGSICCQQGQGIGWKKCGGVRRSRILFSVAVLVAPVPEPVQCLLDTVLPMLQSSPTSIHRRTRRVEILPEVSRRRGHPLLPNSELFMFFDKFIHPYGVNNDTLFNNNDNDGRVVELIDALLPRLRTKEDKSRIMEGFQRARLDEQLRLSKLSSRRGSRRESDDVSMGHDDNQREEDVTRMADLFQQERLAEQLRLSMNRRMGWVTQGSSDGCDRNDSDGKKGVIFDKDEAIHRALLEERLRMRRIQQRKQSQQNCIASDSIERAMVEYETENEKELKTLQLTMVQEKDSDVEDSYDGGGGGGVSNSEKDKVDSIILGAASTNNNSGHNKHIIVSKLPLNETKDEQFNQLNDKLEQLHKMVVMATSSSTFLRGFTWKNATFSVQDLVSTTYLPLPPREDASVVSLIVAPVAHLLSAIFLMGSAVFHAVIAVLDVIYNDDSTRACLRTTSHVLRSCWNYLFLEEARTTAATKRTMRALQTSVIASFYATRCILMRAVSHSKHALACMDTGTGSLRYLVYVIRSVHVLWKRIVYAIQNMYTSLSRGERNQQQTILTPFRILSTIKLPFLRLSQNQRSLEIEQQRLRSNEMYNSKLRLLNIDRVNLERDRQQLKEAQRQLEYERRKLQAESVNILSWYLAARNASAATTTGENETTVKPRVRKWQWNNTWRLGRNNVN
jgi:hypothetical protein